MNTRVKVTITQSMDEAIRVHAKQAGVSASEFIRQAITTKISETARSYKYEAVTVGRPNKKDETK
jgi:Arc/MetJ-type ribon-helix-helix transcriptional regulator